MDQRRGVDLAIGDLYAAHARGLVRLAWLLLHDEQDAEEVVQDAFVALHRRWGRLDDPAAAAAYLRRSVVNGARSALRRRGVRERYAAALAAERVVVALSPSDTVVAAEQRDQLVGALTRLPQRQREVLVLRYYLDLSEAEIADALGISPGSVKTHAHRGLAALRSGQER
ncbi:SigE family RNA polymerase sigma factor [Nostocoides sp. Soil756]|uniref:RNA polymerase sigma factor n=1 Tax=Nostocoides sp. Soil756 TaxID=1736399 RepID=UPI002570C62F|nr:SigE family RNA polymerase sigma factor [Tetrasphaera sp. Soil756]